MELSTIVAVIGAVLTVILMTMTALMAAKVQRGGCIENIVFLVLFFFAILLGTFTFTPFLLRILQ